jgi:hypothetical protein
MYTDGSKKEKKVGYTVVLPEKTIKIRQLPQNSICSAEQSATINAICSTSKCKEKRVMITGFLCTMMAVSDRNSSNNPKTQIIQSLWTKSPQNETADETTKEALDEEIQHNENLSPARSNKNQPPQYKHENNE